MFTGASHFSKALDMLRYGELAEASVFMGAFLFIVQYQLEKVWCHRVFLCVYLDFAAGLSIGDQDNVDFSLSSSLHWFILVISVNFDGDSSTYQLT